MVGRSSLPRATLLYCVLLSQSERSSAADPSDSCCPVRSKWTSRVRTDRAVIVPVKGSLRARPAVRVYSVSEPPTAAPLARLPRQVASEKAATVVAYFLFFLSDVLQGDRVQLPFFANSTPASCMPKGRGQQVNLKM